MAIKSALRPESIVRTRPRSVQSAQNFISGGSPLGSSVVASAANKIVGFQRAAVRPVTPDINSIVSTISSNILTQVDNSIRNATNITNRQVDGKIKQASTNITNQIQQIRQQQTSQVTQLQTVVQNIRQQTGNFVKQLTENYKKRTQDIDGAKPTGILEKFLKAYENALGFIKFFGNSKNIKQVRESLQTLRTFFTESFELAKLIRQTILKIVSQLSNLPKATPGGSPGLNLDIDVPGGPLKRTAPRGVRFGRRGAGLLGLGLGAAAGGMAVNALADSDRLQTLPQDVGSGLTGGIIDSFAFIVNKFANAVEEMIKGSPKKDMPSAQPASSGGAPSSPASPGSSPGGGGMGPVASGSADEKIAAYTAALEGTGGQNAADAMQVMLNRAAQNYGNYGGLGEQVMAAGQFTPIAAAIYGTSGDKDANRAYGHIAPMLGRTPEERKAKLRQIAETEGLQGLDKLFKKNLAGNANTVLADFKSGGPLSQAAMQGVKGRAFFKGQPDIGNKRAEDFYRGTGGNYFHGNPAGKIGTLQPAKPDKGMGMLEGVDPSMIDAGQRRILGIDISQPPPSQAKPSIVSLPLTGGQQQPQQKSGGGGQVIVPPENKGPTVPLLPSSDPDNFLTLYSRIVYNIIDE